MFGFFFVCFFRFLQLYVAEESYQPKSVGLACIHISSSRSGGISVAQMTEMLGLFIKFKCSQQVNLRTYSRCASTADSKIFLMTEVIPHSKQLEKPTAPSRLLTNPQV